MYSVKLTVPDANWSRVYYSDQGDIALTPDQLAGIIPKASAEEITAKADGVLHLMMEERFCVLVPGCFPGRPLPTIRVEGIAIVKPMAIGLHGFGMSGDPLVINSILNTLKIGDLPTIFFEVIQC